MEYFYRKILKWKIRRDINYQDILFGYQHQQLNFSNTRSTESYFSIYSSKDNLSDESANQNLNDENLIEIEKDNELKTFGDLDEIDKYATIHSVSTSSGYSSSFQQSSQQFIERINSIRLSARNKEILINKEKEQQMNRKMKTTAEMENKIEMENLLSTTTTTSTNSKELIADKLINVEVVNFEETTIQIEDDNEKDDSYLRFFKQLSFHLETISTNLSDNNVDYLNRRKSTEFQLALDSITTSLNLINIELWQPSSSCSVNIYMLNNYVNFENDIIELAKFAYKNATIAFYDHSMSIDMIIDCAMLRLMSSLIVNYNKISQIYDIWTNIIQNLYMFSNIQNLLYLVLTCDNQNMISLENKHLFDKLTTMIKTVSKIIGFYCPSAILRKTLALPSIDLKSDKLNNLNAKFSERFCNLNCLNDTLRISFESVSKVFVSAENTLFLVKTLEISPINSDFNYKLTKQFSCFNRIEFENSNEKVRLNTKFELENMLQNIYKNISESPSFNVVVQKLFIFGNSSKWCDYKIIRSIEGTLWLIEKQIFQNDFCNINYQILSLVNILEIHFEVNKLLEIITIGTVANQEENSREYDLCNKIAIAQDKNNEKITHFAIIAFKEILTGIFNSSTNKITAKYATNWSYKFYGNKIYSCTADEFGNLILIIPFMGVLLFKQPWYLEIANSINNANFLLDSDITHINSVACNQGQIYLLLNSEIRIYDYLPSNLNNSCCNHLNFDQEEFKECNDYKKLLSSTMRIIEISCQLNRQCPFIIPEYFYKSSHSIVAIGDSGIGKRSLFASLFKSYDVKQQKSINFKAGYTIFQSFNQEDNKTLLMFVNHEYRSRIYWISQKEVVILLCFSLDNYASLENVILKWLTELCNDFDKDVKVILVGTKGDLLQRGAEQFHNKKKTQAKINNKEIDNIAVTINAIDYIGCSALKNINIDKVMELALDLLKDN